MTYKMMIKSILSLSVLAVMGFSISGCKTAAEYKVDADKQVYDILDTKWDEKVGPKNNFKISDTEPTESDIIIDVEKLLPEDGVCSLSRAVEIATAQNRIYQAQREELYIKALDLTEARHLFQPNLFANGNAGYSKDGDNEVVGGTAGIGFQQMLSSGALISANVAAGWVDVLSGDLRSGLSSILSATITQPLLRGSGRKVAMEQLTQSERDTLYQIRTFNRFRKTFVVDIASQYYQVLELNAIYENARKNYETLEWVYDRTAKLAHAGRIPQFEYAQAKQDALRAKDEMLMHKKEYMQAMDEFKMQLSLPATFKISLDTQELEALRSIVDVNYDFSEDEIIQTAKEMRLDLLNSEDMVADAERKVVVAADALRAELNLVGSARGTSSERGDMNTMSALERKYGVSAEFDLPLDRLAERNLYRKTLITLSQQIRSFEEASDLVGLEVRQAHRDLVEAAERFHVLQQSYQLAEKRFNDTFKLLQYSRSSTRDVLDAQRDLFRAQNGAVTAMVDYTIATLRFYQNAGILELREDGMWKQQDIVATDK